MLTAFLAGATAAGAALLVTGALLMLAGRWSPYRATAPQRVPVLGGAEPETHAWSRFHVRYYPMALLFIAFEMEMMFMYPWAVVFVEEGVTALAEMGMFLGILSVGIVYAWRERAFRWQ
jgi:NADH-quinone oxidoreductase subunit A